jgi:RNA polymerase sigma-70 factor (ECF subfamily)
MNVASSDQSREMQARAARNRFRSGARPDNVSEAYDRWFGAQLEALRPEVFRYTRRLTRSAALADDIVQDTMLRAWRFRSTVHEPSSLKFWLIRIARREHARLHERLHVATVTLDESVEHLGADRRDACLATRADIEAALRALGRHTGKMMVMSAVFGYTVAEIAARCGTPGPRVSVRLFRARKALRSALGDV